MNWPDEIRSTEGLKGLEGDVKINPKELEMAKALIESLADTFDPSRYKDEYKEGLRKIIDAKIAGEEIVAPEVEEPARVVDLMEALKRSLDFVSHDKKRPAKADLKKVAATVKPIKGAAAGAKKRKAA